MTTRLVAEPSSAPPRRSRRALVASRRLARSSEPGVIKATIEREARRFAALGVKPDPLGDRGGDHRAMDRGRHAVDKAQAVEADERPRLRDREGPSRQCDRAEGEHRCERRSALRLDRFGKARRDRRRALQRRRGDETARALTPADQTLVDENFDRAGHRETADPEPLGELRLAVDPVANFPATISDRNQSTS